MPSPTILAASLLLLTATGLAIFLALDLRRFLAGTPTLTSISGVIAFREAVTRQMYGALAVLLLGGSASVVAVTGFYMRLPEWHELPVLIAAVTVFAAAGTWGRLIERRAKAIPVIDEEIRRQRDDVVRVWTTRPLPTWGDGSAA